MYIESYLINSVIQILLFSLVPFVWWLASARKQCGFLAWIGLKGAQGRKEKKLLLWIGGVAAAFSALSILPLLMMRGVETATESFYGMGFSAILPVAIYAMLNTSLPEEILFRGFLLKRFSRWWGFEAGNLVQSLLFGGLHGVLFCGVIDLWKCLLLVVFTGMIAWFMGFVNEKKADGSILPSWSIHAIANILSGLCSAFALI